MKTNYRLLITLSFVLLIASATAQSHQPATATTERFAKMFPDATKVDWKEKTNNFTVFFDRNGRKCEAKFDKTGQWLSTEETIPLDSLPRPVQNAFKAGKYAAWRPNSAYSIQSANEPIKYHLVVTSNEAVRKILFFNSEGNLLADR